VAIDLNVSKWTGLSLVHFQQHNFFSRACDAREKMTGGYLVRDLTVFRVLSEWLILDEVVEWVAVLSRSSV